MAAGAVSHGADPVEIERGVELGELVDAGGDVEERLRPASAVPDPPVLEIPGSKPVCDEVFAEPAHQRQVVAGPPEAAVDDDDHWEPLGLLVGKEELPELACVVPVTVH